MILGKSDQHNQFVVDSSDIKMSPKSVPFIKDDKWDDWSKIFKECLGSLMENTRLPLSCIIGSNGEPRERCAMTLERTVLSP